MSYPGNPSLSTAVKDRVVSTFQQTLALYKQGRTDEVFAGCNLLLQMDPLFDPAKKLLDKARNPMAPIDVDSLMPKDADDAMVQAKTAMAGRDFQRVIHLTTEILTNDLMNDEARILGDEARDKLEAGPFVDQFVKKVEQFLRNGNTSAARTDLEKARALDATHPDVVRVAKALIAAENQPAPSSGFGGQPSFVVDAPAAPAGRGAAQASDFGFTFEEDKAAAPAAGGFTGFSFDSPAPAAPAAPSGFGGGGGGFSFDSPAAPAAPAGDGLSGFSFGAPTPAAPAADAPFAGGFSFDSPATPKPAAAGEFDFSTASIETSPDDQKKIDQYLADGDRAANGGDYQQAIDLWSRIFLIDVTNEAASDRIEKAKAKRRDIETKVEGILSAGVQAYERKDAETARAKFAEVLRADPGNITAQDYMDRLADSVTEGGAGAVTTDYIPPTPTKADLFEDDEMPMGFEAPLMPHDTLAPPPPSAAPAKGKAVAKTAAAPSAPKKTISILPILGIVGLLLLAAGGWFIWSRMSTPEADPAATQATFSRAAQLASRGRYDQAIAMLRDVKPDDPQHDKALELIAEYQAKQAAASQTIEGKSPGVYYDEQVAAGRTAFEAHDYVTAKAAWEQAQRVKPLPPDVAPNYEAAAQQVGKLSSAKTLFAEGKYAEAITSLQPLLEQDPQNKNIRKMITDAHFNLGVAALNENRLQDAVKEFDEVLKAEPADEMAKRSRDLAERYNGQTKDLLYNIYVKYLPKRTAG